MFCKNQFVDNAKGLFHSSFNTFASSLLTTFAPVADGFASNTPVVGIDLFDNNKRCLRIFTEYIDQKLGCASNQGVFLCFGRAFFSDFDVDIRHGVPPLWSYFMPCLMR